MKTSLPLYVLMALLAGFLGWLQTLGHEVQKRGTEELPPISAEFLMLARHAIGAQSMMTGPADKTTNAAMFKQLTSYATDPWERVRLVPLSAELQGKEACLALLETLKQDETMEYLAEDLASLEQIYTQGPDTLDQAARQELLARHGWLSQLALSYGLPDNSPSRKQALAPAKRAEFGYVAMFLVGTLALILGAALLVFGSMAVVQGRLTLAYETLAASLAPHNTAFLEVMVLALALLPCLSFLGSLLPFTMAPVLQTLPLLLPLWLLKRGYSFSQLRQSMGWFRGKGVIHEVGCGILGYLAGLPILGLGLLVSAFLMGLSSSSASHPIVEMFQGASAFKISMLFLMACVVAPVVEETLFRGALFHHLRSQFRFLPAALIQGLVFAIIHPQGWAAVPVLGSIAVVLAGIREWRGSLIGPMVAHAMNNGVMLLLMMLLLL